jgi:hypothetical protein
MVPPQRYLGIRGMCRLSLKTPTEHDPWPEQFLFIGKTLCKRDQLSDFFRYSKGSA